MCIRAYRLVVESKESERGGGPVDGAVLVASLTLVDLAGSESVRHTGATGQRAKVSETIHTYMTYTHIYTHTYITYTYTYTYTYTHTSKYIYNIHICV